MKSIALHALKVLSGCTVGGLLGGLLGLSICSVFFVIFGMDDEITSSLALLFGVFGGLGAGASAGGCLVDAISFGRTPFQMPAIRAILGALLLPLLVSGTLTWTAVRLSSPPTDQNLLDQFSQNQKKLDALVQMTKVDPGLLEQSLVSEFGVPLCSPTGNRDKVSPARLEQFRKMLHSAPLPLELSGYSDSAESEVEFLAWNNHESAKGFAYLKSPPHDLLKNLDHAFFPELQGKYHRHIQGNWYLFYAYRAPD